MTDDAPLPEVSVILPAHNAADRLPRALRSVLAQRRPAVEVIVVDDASADGTFAVAQAFAAADPRVRAIRSAQNLGPGGARNLGLEAARGQWIALLDSDDAFLPSRLQHLLDGAGAADMVADNLLLVGEADGGAGAAMLPPSLLDAPTEVDAVAFLRGNLPIRNHPRVSYGFLKPMIRRAFLERHRLRYRDGLRFAEDFDFYLRCLLAGGRFMLLPKAGYAYSVRTDSLTARHGRSDLARLKALHRLVRAQAAAKDDDDLAAAMAAHRRSIERRLTWCVVGECLARGRWRRAYRTATRTTDSLLLVVRELAHALPVQLARRLRRLLTPTVSTAN